jgi:hypothetical protein
MIVISDIVLQYFVQSSLQNNETANFVSIPSTEWTVKGGIHPRHAVQTFL